MSDAAAFGLVDHLFRERSGQMVAWLTRVFGPAHLELAEEVVQDALLKALQQWPYSGVPQNPGGWLFQVARNGALDVVRRRASFQGRAADIAAELARTAHLAQADHSTFSGVLRDDELRMVCLCCHPTLPRDARIALSLKTVGGFSVAEIARAFLVPESTVAQRLVRAKRQLRAEGVAFDLPGGSDLATRIDSVLDVVYLLFNEGYAARSGDDLVRVDLCAEALRLARLIASSAETAAPAAHALVALIAFQAARLPARVDAAGEVVLLEHQDRGSWDARLIALGFAHFERSAEGCELTSFHVQAAIAAAHAGAPSFEATRWDTILELYDQLMALAPSPLVALNRVVAVWKTRGSEAALGDLAQLETESALTGYYLLPAVKGRLLAERGADEAARRAFEAALDCPCSEPERRLLQRRLHELGDGRSPASRS